MVVKELGWEGPVFKISALTKRGTEKLAYAVMEYLDEQNRLDQEAEEEAKEKAEEEAKARQIATDEIDQMKDHDLWADALDAEDDNRRQIEQAIRKMS